MDITKYKNLDFDTLMTIKPKTTHEKLVWERYANKHLVKKNDELQKALNDKNSILKKELDFYKELYTEGYFKGCNLEDGNIQQIKNQKKELNRLCIKMFNLKQEHDLRKSKYYNLKKAISNNIEKFVMELDKVHAEGSRFINPVESFFKMFNK